ncbi:integrator complex subunit 13-like [Rhopilema esculentum]|uniref:integrator complex subunit 13-like n=1 Tax=Rhopilema esculentum TaxID=499914 RepID=UPI0031E24F23
MHLESESEEAMTQRTAVVLDHGNAVASLNNIRIEVSTEGGTPSSSKHRSSSHANSIGTLAKSVWTVMVEAAVEYCRIIYDLLPDKYMVQLVVSDTDSKKLNSFKKEEQNISQILKGFANIGPPNEDYLEENDGDDYFAYPGLESAVISVIENFKYRKDLQDEVKQSSFGRIIFITSLNSEKDTKPLISRISEIQERYDIERECHLDLVIVNVSNVADKITKEKKQISGTLSASTVTFRASFLPPKMIMLAKKHFNLRSTAITGIPMKEEQHAGTSANYDVEIIHPAEVHHETYWFCTEGQGIVGSNFGSSKQRESYTKSIITLKWCTPKSSSNNELLQCIGAYRCTPAEVNSRPAACLISFLQQGRTVLLEQPKRSGAKVISHMLVSHGGDVYIHVLATGRNPVEDPPSISEGCGGRVTDYRIEDFGKFMKENRLAPYPNAGGTGEELPVEKGTLISVST